MPEGLTLQRHRFKVNERDYDRPSDSFFGVFRSSVHEERVVALFQPLSEKHADEVARKITHYGSYSYLVFREGRNEAKGTWPVTESRSSMNGKKSRGMEEWRSGGKEYWSDGVFEYWMDEELENRGSAYRRDHRELPFTFFYHAYVRMRQRLARR